ncbi:MAG: 23S rRNA (adenine(2503)-C(2))-methyltransferase RlmN [Nitrospirota bacterium]
MDIKRKDNKINLLEFNAEGLKAIVEGLGMRPYRAAQICRWIYSDGKDSFPAMTDISKADREKLQENAEICPPELSRRLVSHDKTEKHLFSLQDGEKVESVLIPDEDRLTLCISSQAGCALGCRFCLTGAGGIRRDLLPHEITGQVLVAGAGGPVSGRLAADGPAVGRKITNIVLMGMGEPLLNADNVFEALKRLISPAMFNISPRRITLSTAGIVPGIKALGESGLNVNLAVSVNAPNDEIRDSIMPINKKYPLKALIKALKGYPLAPRRRITVEYVMLKGINDKAAHAAELGKLLRGLKCKINLIPYNEHEGSEFKRPDDDAVLAFQEKLRSMNYTAFIRESRGADILAACGQLRGRSPEKP